MHLRDHGLGRVKEPERGRDIGRQQLAPGDGPADRALGLLGQVVAGREGPAGALEDDDPDAVVGFCLVEGGHECGNEFAVEGVELRRAVQREPDAPRRAHGQEHGLVGIDRHLRSRERRRRGQHDQRVDRECAPR